jgi:hypothetical protein
VRIPGQKIAALADVPGVKFIEVNAPVASASTAAIAAARVPLPGNADYVAPSSAIGVAIVDSGIAAHADLNVASRVVLADARWTMWNSYVDYFWNTASWSGSDGTDPWQETPWTELGDDGNAATGRVTVEQDYCPDWSSICAEIDTVAVGTGIERAARPGRRHRGMAGLRLPAAQPQRVRGSRARVEQQRRPDLEHAALDGR